MNLQAYTCISRLYNIAFEFEYWYIYYYYIVIVILLLSILFTRCLKKGILIEMAITPLESFKNWKVAAFWKLKHACYIIGIKMFTIGGWIAKKYDLVVGKPPLKNFDPIIEEIANFKIIILSHFFSNFKHFAAYPAEFMLNFPKHSNFINIWWISEEQWTFQ